MTTHLLKLCVGASTVEDLSDWQTLHLRELRRTDRKARLSHVTRMTPKLRYEILDGGSLYWVIKGQIAVRQRILDLESVLSDGVPHCAIVLDPKIVPVARRAQRPFQGWRYLRADAAPADLDAGSRNLPPDLQSALQELGLL